MHLNMLPSGANMLPLEAPGSPGCQAWDGRGARELVLNSAGRGELFWLLAAVSQPHGDGDLEAGTALPPLWIGPNLHVAGRQHLTELGQLSLAPVVPCCLG